MPQPKNWCNGTSHIFHGAWAGGTFLKPRKNVPSAHMQQVYWETGLAMISVLGTIFMLAKLVKIVPPFLNRKFQGSFLTWRVANMRSLNRFKSWQCCGDAGNLIQCHQEIGNFVWQCGHIGDVAQCHARLPMSAMSQGHQPSLRILKKIASNSLSQGLNYAHWTEEVSSSGGKLVIRVKFNLFVWCACFNPWLTLRSNVLQYP